MSQQSGVASIRAAPSQVVATAIHAGHDLRPSIAARMALDESARLREEDPHTDALIPEGAAEVVVHRSRFEVDMNRPRDAAVYRGPDDAWGLDIWHAALPPEEVDLSLQEHHEFYRDVAAVLDEVADRGPFVVLDLHSYNHRRRGPNAAPDAPAHNPVVNVGTGSLDRSRWGSLVEGFLEDLGQRSAAGQRLDVRENVRFRGGNLSRWVNTRYQGQGCALALEFKKVFMDEWTGELDSGHLAELAAALDDVVPALLDRLATRP